MKRFLAIFLVGVMAAGCSSEKVSADRLEEARQVAKDNATLNAQLYRAANPRFTGDYNIVSRSDDGQTSTCPQGDGWAQVSIMKVDGKAVDKTVLLCSTYSTSVGCYREEDFNKNPNLSKLNSGCSSEVPFPIPVLKK
ncbi:MAG: hypothetical protein HQM06_13335 [Magnetococcales bacterium]|nr:hypothetical protein [Magnetococcales bacterium]